jgi:hypothetical protein
MPVVHVKTQLPTEERLKAVAQLNASELEQFARPGLAPVATLQLNKEALVNLRRILYAVGEHPPD